MRLSRSFLLLAAGLATQASAANVYVDTTTLAANGGTQGDYLVDTTQKLGANDFFIGDADLTINLVNNLGAPISTTFIGHFKQGDAVGGTLIKTGGGTLQYDGFNDNETTYFHNRTFSLLLNPIPAPTDIRAGSLNAFSGTIIVQQGQLQVSGAINQWADYGGIINVPTGMLGAQQVILGSGTRLSFQNTQLNLVGERATLTGNTANIPATPLVARLNFVNNVQGTADSEVNVGKTADYILVAHSDFAAVGLAPDNTTSASSIGVLSGSGRFYKTGDAAMIFRGNSTFDGEVVLGGGATYLTSANGDSLWSAKSVNLASVGAGQGTNTPWRPDGTDTGTETFWKPGYAPGAGVAALVVSGTQHIRNFQSLFGETGVYQPILPGTGVGTTVLLSAATDVLRITQEANYDGYYRGTFDGAGTLIKDGAGTLALRLAANNLPTVYINEGKLVANVQSLGAGVINIAAGAQLSIYQNDSGALRAEIRATSSLAELRFKPSDEIFYRGSATATTVGNTDAGLADIVRAQPNFFGKVIVEDGNAIVFSEGNNNAFLNAASIQLLNGESGRETSIRFNDTNQVVNNLSGDAYTRIFLGRGNITLGVTAASTYQGAIEGVGNLVKGGSANFTLAGDNIYFGATVVRTGNLAVSKADGIRNTSGLVLVGTKNTFTGTGAQSFGSLFGASDAVVNAGSLTIGVSADLRGRLDAELLNLPIDVPPVDRAYYLATETTDSVVGFNPGTTEFFVLQQRLFPTVYASVYAANYNTYLAAILAANPGISAEDAATQATAQVTTTANAQIFAQLDTITVDGTLDAAEIQAHRDLLGFAGTLNLGSGSLTKVGIERLILTGTANYTGLTDVQGGILEVGIDTLKGTSGINLGSAGTFAISVATNRSYTVPITGSGTFQKLGAGRLDLDSSSSAFSGTYDVVEGTLAVTFAPTVVGGTTTTQGSASLAAGSTFIAKVANSLDWSGQVFGTGTFVKTGAGVLTLTTGYIFHDGLTDVQQGGLVVSAMPAGDLNLAAGTSYTDNVADTVNDIDDYYTHAITGAGHLIKAGLGDLRIESAQPGFTGQLTVEAGSLTLVAANAFSAAQGGVELKSGTTLFLLNGDPQSLGNIDAKDGSTIDVEVAGTDLTFTVAAGASRTFLGRILGNPDVIKDGTGTLLLTRPDATPNQINSITVNAGILEASHGGMGGADVTLATAGTLRFVADAGATETYTLTIAGDGHIAKTGDGTVDLTGATMTAVNLNIDVVAGTLIVSETALGNGRAPLVTVAADATFEYLATNSATFGVGNFVGLGGVTFGRTGANTPTITLNPGLDGQVGYGGLTTVRNGVTLRLGGAFTGIGSLATEAGSTLDLSLIPSLTITQAVDATFAGALTGSANLTLKGAGVLTVTANGGTLDSYNVGTITVDGGTLALDLANTKSIAFANGGTLLLRGVANNYTGGITGAANVVLQSGVDIDLTAGLNATTTSLGSAGVALITLSPGSHLTANLTTGSAANALGDTPIRLDGGLLTVTGTGAITLSLAEAAATPGTPTGTAGLQLLGTGAYEVSGRVIGDLSIAATTSAIYIGAAKTGANPPADITGDVAVNGTGILQLGKATGGNGPVTVAGDVTVANGAILSGSWALSGTLVNSGIVAPGFSPAHVTQAAVDNSLTLQMEVSSDSEDQVAFTGSAILNRNDTGRLEVNRYGAGHSYGVRHVLFKDTVSPGAGSYVSAAAEDPRFSEVVSVGTSTTAVRHLLVYPRQLQGGLDGILGNADDAQDPLRSLAKPGEIAVYEVRSALEYDSPAAAPHITDWLKVITEVNLVEDPLNPGQWTSTLGAGFTALGARFATLSGSQLAQAIDNLSARGQYSLAAVAVAGARADQAAVVRHLEQNRFDMAGSTVKTSQWYVEAIGGRTSVDEGPSASIAGATAGLIRDLGFDGYAGVSLGLDKSKGSSGRASVDTTGFRLGAFGGFMTDNRVLALDAGLSFASLSGDLSHPSVFGTANGGSAKANTLSGWLRASAAVGLDANWSLTPFAQFEASSTRLTDLSETGQVDALDVADVTLNETSATIGMGIQCGWSDDRGGWRYRLSLDVAYLSQISGDTLSLKSGIPSEGLDISSASHRVLPGSGLSLAPTFTFGPDPDSSYTLGLRFDQASQGKAVSGEFGYRKRF